MNYLIVVEGKQTETKVYPEWIKHCFPHLNEVKFPVQLKNDQFCIISGDGYPHYLQTIQTAIDEIIDKKIECRLIVSADAEERSQIDVYHEIEKIILAHPQGKQIDYRILIQNFSIECWALGNRKIFPKIYPKTDEDLMFFINQYNVSLSDPEQIPVGIYDGYNTRAQFATAYLKRILQQKNLSYSKSNPKVIAHPTYYNELKKRYVSTQHLASFVNFEVVFR